MIQKKEWKLGESYNYGREVAPLNTPDHDYQEHNMVDPVRLGRGFVTVSDEKDNVLSFIIDGWNPMYGCSMKLVYKD